jgi:hydroxymethylbilane synthase
MLKIATRKSQLALIQSEMIKAALVQKGHHEVELLPMTTTGDENKNRQLQSIGGKGLFTKEIEQALLNNDAQIAMHSLKDMPVEMPEGLVLAGVLPRETAFDWLISHAPLSSLAELPKAARVGTSSPRRTAQLLRLRPDIEIVPFRGNVPTRLAKVEAGEVDATILAAAGLKRLGLQPRYVLPLPCLPAIGQGIVAIQCREDDAETYEKIQQITHPESWYQAAAERAVLKAVEGDCHTPLAAYAEIEEERITLTAEILSLDGQTHYHETREGPLSEAATLGQQCGEALKERAKALWQDCS